MMHNMYMGNDVTNYIRARGNKQTVLTKDWMGVKPTKVQILPVHVYTRQRERESSDTICTVTRELI